MSKQLFIASPCRKRVAEHSEACGLSAVLLFTVQDLAVCVQLYAPLARQFLSAIHTAVMTEQPTGPNTGRSHREVILCDGIATLVFMVINSVWDEVRHSDKDTCSLA